VSTETRRALGASTTYSLIASLEGTELQRVEVTTAALTIGRLPENSLVLRDQAVSRRHAELRLDQGRPMLADSGSASGTFMGGDRLLAGQPVVLEPGVEVRIGPYVLMLKSEATLVPVPVPAPLLPPVYAPPESAVRQPVPDELPTVVARPTWPAPLPATDRSRYTQHLPAIFQDADFLGRMLLIFEAIWEPLEQRQEHIAMYFSPATGPAQMLAWMAEWLNLELDSHWPERRRRELLREAMQLYWWRGTRYGLTRMLEICTDQPVKITEDPDRPFVFRIMIPARTDVSRDFIERLVRAHKPAHVGYVLEINPT
jgi:phage tail-like protein